MRRSHPHVCVRQCRVVKRHECGPGGLHDEGTDDVSSIGGEDQGCCSTSQSQSFRLAEVLFLPKINDLLEGHSFTVGASNVPSCVAGCGKFRENRGSHTVRSGQEPQIPGGTRAFIAGWAVSPGNRGSLHCVERPRAAHLQEGTNRALRDGGKPRKPRSHTARNGQGRTLQERP